MSPSLATASPGAASSMFVGLGGVNSAVNGVSADGSVAVGASTNASGSLEAYRWTAGGGLVGLGNLPGGASSSMAYGVSGDGSTVVGQGDTASGFEAFRWTAGGGMVGLGFLPGGSASGATGVSADGSTVVGFSDSASGKEAFVWTAAGGMMGLGDLAGASVDSQANAVSADGSTVVGRGYTPSGYRAFVWDASHGMRQLDQVLTAQGVDLTGWTLFSATAVSADGRTIVGSGDDSLSSQTEAWLAVIPEPGLTLLLGIALLVLCTARRRGAPA